MNLFDKLVVYGNSAEVQSIQEGYQASLDMLIGDVEDVEKQLFVDTATWGLALWEAYLGILPDADMAYSTRREVIKSKLRGAGTTTVSMIKNVAEAYVNGEVEVAEDNSGYTFTITFVSSRGQPPGLVSLKGAIEDIKPAHLGVNYIFIYTTHEELRPMTHAELAAYTHAQIRELEV